MTGKLGIDKAAAGRFIKHAIAQAKNTQLVDESSDAVPAASSSSSNERVPVRVTSKMMARTEYEQELKEVGSEQEEDLEVFDEEAADEDEDEEARDTDGPPEDTGSIGLDKGKGRASEEVSSSRRKRARVDPFSGEYRYVLSECQRLPSLTISRVRKSGGLWVATPDNRPQQEVKAFRTRTANTDQRLFTRSVSLDSGRSRGGKGCKEGEA